MQYDDGLLSAEWSRIDIQWTPRHDYNYHCTDAAGVNLRWGPHPHDEDYIQVPGFEHHHPAPNASSDPAEVEISCIKQRPETPVTRAVITLWRTAYHAEALDPLNSGSNPP